MQNEKNNNNALDNETSLNQGNDVELEQDNQLIEKNESESDDSDVNEDKFDDAEAINDTKNEDSDTNDVSKEKKDKFKRSNQNDNKKARLKLFERLVNRKALDTKPTITKGVKNEYIHSNFKRKKEEEPDPETFPKKKKILSWQEEEIFMVKGLEFDQELSDEIAEIAERKD